MFSYKHWLTWRGLCQNEIDIVKKAKKYTHKHSAVHRQIAQGFFYVFGVSNNIMLPGDCTSSGEERTRKEFWKSCCSQAWNWSLSRRNSQTEPWYSPSCVLPYRHTTLRLSPQAWFGLKVYLRYIYNPVVFSLSEKWSDLWLKSLIWSKPCVCERLHSYATHSFTGSHYVPLRSGWVTCAT